jgi:predicted DNA-binding transcriptional regulator AlpA
MDAINKSKLRTVVRWKAVLAATGYSKSQLEELIRRGQFPPPFPLSDGARAVGWWQDELLAHQEQRDAQRTTAAKQRSEVARERYEVAKKEREEREERKRAGEEVPLSRTARRKQLREQRREAQRSEAPRERVK